MLREKSRPVAAVDKEIRTLAADMIETMREAEGVGLAAQQIGETRSICVIAVPPDHDRDGNGGPLHPHLVMPLVLLNPTITELSRKTEGREEGCLSFPDIRGSIPRSVEITVSFTDLEGRARVEQLRGFVARVVQHEVDHLNGVLFIDRMSPAKKFALKRRLAALKSATEERAGRV